MKLEKAIEIARELPSNLNDVLDHDQQDAIKLLIEAGKHHKKLRDAHPYSNYKILPGETVDSVVPPLCPIKDGEK